MSIPFERLYNQYVTRRFRGPVEDLVSSLGAVQAQEYPFAKWGLALRFGGTATDAAIERAFDEGRILRTHVMRATWHFVAATDIVWMLQLTAPRVHASLASYLRRAGLEQQTLTRAVSIMERALGGGHHLTRAELRARLASQRITLSSQNLGFVMLYAELERVVCSGPRRGRQFTYALLEERARDLTRRSGDEALAELARRFFATHGPATVRDFVWWSGLRTSDARRGLAMIRAKPFEEDGLTYWSTDFARRSRPSSDVHLLPIYDEYLVAYRDRVAVPHAWRAGTAFRHALIIDGQVAGTWRTETTGSSVKLLVTPLVALNNMERGGVAGIARRYAGFLNLPVAVHIS